VPACKPLVSTGPMTPDRTKAARDLLAFYLEAGADSLLGEEPVDRFAGDEAAPSIVTAAPEPPAPAPQAPAPRPSLRPRGSTERAAPPPAPSAPASPDVATMDARAQARAAASLDELRRLVDGFDGCELKRHAKQLVFADGNPQARVMFVGEAPGRDEDQEGLPFVGRSGKLLDLMLKAIGLDRTTAYIANVIPWRPPGNRTPTPQETQICLPFIQRQIELVDPEVLVCLGGPSSQTLLGFSDGIMKMRGRWLTYNTGTREIRAIATLHPAYLLRQPLHKRLAWRDFLAIKKALGN
jgi:uracil-DNA glycosylase family 4